MKENVPHFRDFVPEFVAALEDTLGRCPFDDFEISRVFVYLIAELFETTGDGFVYTDGGRELGIDFYVQNDQSYSIYQCKSVQQDRLEELGKPPTFDATTVNELLEAVAFLRDKSGSHCAVRDEIRELRTKYQRDLTENPAQTHLNATLAILGSLTPGGRQRFETEREELAKHGVTLSVIDWADIYRELHKLEPLPLDGMKVDLRVDDIARDILRQNDWILGLVYARELIDAFNEYGVRLFDMNVRNEIKGSKINRAIVESLKSTRGRKNFHHLNNGLLILCKNYRFPHRAGEPIVLYEPQVVNGCQTITSLWRAYKDLVPSAQEELRGTVKVQVKVIQNMEQEMVDEVVITTNNQNPMKPRNLKSNTREQRDIQRSFRSLPSNKWFYIRKDGEFESTSQRGQKVRWFSRSDYEVSNGVGRPRYRVLDNEAVAKAWYSFIGFSGEAMISGADYFGNEATYRRVFLVRPSTQYWERFASLTFEKPSEDLFDKFTPTAHQYLLAVAIDSYIRASNPSPQKNRKDSIARLVQSGHLKGNIATGETTSTQAEIAKALAGDDLYLRTTYLYNMENVLTELAAFMLVRRYGHFTPEVAFSLLKMPDLHAWCSRAFSQSPEDEVFHVHGAILGSLYGFLSWAVGKNYFTEAKYEIEAAPRPKAYFGRRQNINQMRKVVVESDGLCTDSVRSWKRREGVTFLQSLPDLRA